MLKNVGALFGSKNENDNFSIPLSVSGSSCFNLACSEFSTLSSLRGNSPLGGKLSIGILSTQKFGGVLFDKKKRFVCSMQITGVTHATKSY
jgi:hypothetical protein